MTVDPKVAKSMLDAGRREGMTEDAICDLLLLNLWQMFEPLVDRRAFARALERWAVKLMEAPTTKN